MIALYSILFLLLFWFSIYLVSLALSNRSKESNLLADLGLARRWTGERTTPFFKWGWKKISRERVWGERIVKSAFNKAKIWLSPEDYQFFSTQCHDNEAGKTINVNNIINRVQKIVARNEKINSHIGTIVQNVLTHATSLSNSEAEKLLREMKYKAERDDPLTHLIKVEFRRKLKQAGMYIMGYQPYGLELTNTENEIISKLKGLESWAQFLQTFEDECLKQLSNKVSPPYDKVFFVVKKGIQVNLFKDFKSDIADTRKFRSIMSLSIEEDQLDVSYEEIIKLDSILYTWKFDDNIPFSFPEHRQIRELIAQKDTAPRFRQLVIKSITPETSSLRRLVHLFPRNVIFYGKNARARTFIAQQYLYHLNRVLETIPRIEKFENRPPALLRISDREINDYRRHVAELKAKEKAFTLPHKEPIEIEIPQYIHQVIRQEVYLSLNKRNISEEDAHQLGWIINLGIDEPTNHELSELMSADFRDYVRINCDTAGEADYTSIGHNAKQHRLMLFNSVLESLISAPIMKNSYEQLDWTPKDSFVNT